MTTATHLLRIILLVKLLLLQIYLLTFFVSDFAITVVPIGPNIELDYFSVRSVLMCWPSR